MRQELRIGQTRVSVVPDPDTLSEEAARRFATQAREAVGTHGRFSVALSGGSTPQGLYHRLSQPAYRDQIPWDGVHLFWGDERCVPPDHPESNYRLARDTLIAHVPIPPDQVHRMPGEEEPAAAARAYARALEDFFCGPHPRFDLVLLGLGADGHTASLFPGSLALEETERLVVPVEAEYGSRPTCRLTLTLPALRAARHVLFLVAGAGKAPILARALTEDVGEMPAARVVPTAGEVTWLVDEAATGALAR
jgi:6-phosphogluconolactonase